MVHLSSDNATVYWRNLICFPGTRTSWFAVLLCHCWWNMPSRKARIKTSLLIQSTRPIYSQFSSCQAKKWICIDVLKKKRINDNSLNLSVVLFVFNSTICNDVGFLACIWMISYWTFETVCIYRYRPVFSYLL